MTSEKMFAIAYKDHFYNGRPYVSINFDKGSRNFRLIIGQFDDFHKTKRSFTNDPYDKIRVYSNDKKAQMAISRMKDKLLAEINDDKMIYKTGWNHEEDVVFPFSPDVIKKMVEYIRAVAVKKVDNIFSEITVKERVIQGFDIRFVGGQKLQVLTKKAQSYDKCISCGYSFDNKLGLPFLRGRGNSFCLCKMCMEEYMKEMNNIKLPEGLEQDYRRKRMLQGI